MPSRNSVNKPKDNILRNRKASALGQKRASIRAKGNSLSTLHIQASPASLAHSLYKNKTRSKTPVTTQTLSSKRLLKIERNKKYVEARNATKKSLLAARDVDMDIDNENDQDKTNKVTLVRNALWSVVENGIATKLPTGNGTTLGNASF